MKEYFINRLRQHCQFKYWMSFRLYEKNYLFALEKESSSKTNLLVVFNFNP